MEKGVWGVKSEWWKRFSKEKRRDGPSVQCSFIVLRAIHYE